jgi:hypothetical protein
MERRNSDNDQHRRQSDNPDVFDDDFEIDPDEDDFMPSVSDGFRPANANDGHDGDRPNHDRNDTIQRHTSMSKPPPPESDLRRTATRNSTAKVRDSTAHDSRPHAMHNRGPSSPSPLAHRMSVSSTGSFATTSNGDNSFETGPSHPYGMYPQHTMARTSSVATASTDRQPHRSMSLQRPTHPYAMYSQSGINEDMDEPLPTEPGEEQDIIGPDGHTEQLPPYSRYPDEGPTKASLAAEASASRIIPAPNPVDPEDPFMTPASPVSPLSATTFSAPSLPSVPLLEAVTPARLPPQRPETQTGNTAPVTSAYSSANQVPAEPTESSSASLLTTEQSFNEKEEPTETKPRWYKRKLWGRIPLGVLLIVLVMFFVFAVALGAAIGTILAKKHGGKHKTEPGRPDEP